jgi:hypothetical protein
MVGIVRGSSEHAPVSVLVPLCSLPASVNMIPDGV